MQYTVRLQSHTFTLLWEDTTRNIRESNHIGHVMSYRPAGYLIGAIIGLIARQILVFCSRVAIFRGHCLQNRRPGSLFSETREQTRRPMKDQYLLMKLLLAIEAHPSKCQGKTRNKKQREISRV
jgi:hypothetical protein